MKVVPVVLVVSMCAVSGLSQTQSPAAGVIKLRGCLQGDGSPEKPWILAGVVLPAPVTAAPTPAAGRGGGRGARADAAAPAAPAAPAPPQPQVSLRISGMNMSPWRDMRVELEGSLAGAASGGGLREFRVVSARSAYGQCPAR